MADDFIPLNQSTPVQKKKTFHCYHQGGKQVCWVQSADMGLSNRKQNGNNSHKNNSFRNYSNRNDTNDDINAYLHPSMLQDPWAYLRRQNAEK